MNSFYENNKIQRVMDAVAAGQAANETAVVDMVGFESVTFLALLGDVGATGTVVMKIQQGDLSDGSDMSDLSGATAAITAGDDDMLLAVEVYRPQKRYVQAIVTTATADGAIDGVIAIQSDPKERPVSQDSDTLAAFTFKASPDEA